MADHDPGPNGGLFPTLLGIALTAVLTLLVFMWFRVSGVLARLLLITMTVLMFVIMAFLQTFHNDSWLIWSLYLITLFFLILLNFLLLRDDDRIPEGVGQTCLHIALLVFTMATNSRGETDGALMVLGTFWLTLAVLLMVAALVTCPWVMRTLIIMYFLCVSYSCSTIALTWLEVDISIVRIALFVLAIIWWFVFLCFSYNARQAAIVLILILLAMLCAAFWLLLRQLRGIFWVWIILFILLLLFIFILYLLMRAVRWPGRRPRPTSLPRALQFTTSPTGSRGTGPRPRLVSSPHSGPSTPNDHLSVLGSRGTGTPDSVPRAPGSPCPFPGPSTVSVPYGPQQSTWDPNSNWWSDSSGSCPPTRSVPTTPPSYLPQAVPGPSRSFSDSSEPVYSNSGHNSPQALHQSNEEDHQTARLMGTYDDAYPTNPDGPIEEMQRLTP